MYAQKSGFLYHAQSEQPQHYSLYAGDSGLIIFSRYPVTKSAFKIFSWGHGGDSEVSRGVLFAEIVIGDKKLHAFTTHTQCDSFFGGTPEVVDISMSVRNHSIVEITQFI